MEADEGIQCDDCGSAPPETLTLPEDMLERNRSLQIQLQQIVKLAESVREKNSEMRELCNTLIYTRQQQSKTRRTARPIKAPISMRQKGQQSESQFQMQSSFWSHEGQSPRWSRETQRLRSLLSSVPPSFRQSFAWTAEETHALCYAILSLAQEKLSQHVFTTSLEEPSPVETLRAGIEECRKVRLDSELALETVRAFGSQEWQSVSERLRTRRSALECLIQWTAFVRPDRNQRAFTQEEAKQLQIIAKKRNHTDWTAISDELGTKRHPAECLRFYRQNCFIPNRRWTQDDDAILLKASKEGGLKALKLLSSEMDRDFRIVMGRLKVLQKTSLNKRKWNVMEDLTLLKGVLRHGMHWDLIAEEIPYRNGSQCRERYVYTLRPSLSRERRSLWTKDDAEKLMMLGEEHIEQYGKIRWAELAKNFKGISPRDLLNKWNSLMEQKGR